MTHNFLNKKVTVVTNGCPENRIDAARMLKYLNENDYITTENPEQADLILFNACGLTDYSQKQSVDIINKLTLLLLLDNKFAFLELSQLEFYSVFRN